MSHHHSDDGEAETFDHGEVKDLILAATEESSLSLDQADASARILDLPPMHLSRRTDPNISGIAENALITSQKYTVAPSQLPAISDDDDLQPVANPTLAAAEKLEAGKEPCKLNLQRCSANAVTFKRTIGQIDEESRQDHRNRLTPASTNTPIGAPPDAPPDASTEYKGLGWEQIKLPVQPGKFNHGDIEQLAQQDLESVEHLFQTANELESTSQEALQDLKHVIKTAGKLTSSLAGRGYVPFPAITSPSRRSSDEDLNPPERRRKGSTGQAVPVGESPPRHSPSQPTAHSSRPATGPTTKRKFGLHQGALETLSWEEWKIATNDIEPDSMPARLQRDGLRLRLRAIDRHDRPRTTGTIPEEDHPGSGDEEGLAVDDDDDEDAWEDVESGDEEGLAVGGDDDEDAWEGDGEFSSQDKGKGKAAAVQDEQPVITEEDRLFEEEMERFREEEQMRVSLAISRQQELQSARQGESSDSQPPVSSSSSLRGGPLTTIPTSPVLQQSGESSAMEVDTDPHEGQHGEGEAVAETDLGQMGPQTPTSQSMEIPERPRTPHAPPTQPQGLPLPLHQDILSALGGKDIRVRVYQDSNHDDRKIQDLMAAAPATADKLLEHLNTIHGNKSDFSTKWLQRTVGQKHCYGHYVVDRGATNKRIPGFKAGYQCQMCATRKRACAKWVGESLVIFPVIDEHRAGKAWTEIEYWILTDVELGGPKRPPSKKGAKKWTKTKFVGT